MSEGGAQDLLESAVNIGAINSAATMISDAPRSRKPSHLAVKAEKNKSIAVRIPRTALGSVRPQSLDYLVR